MIIIFGWEKTAEPLGFIGKLYCYDCRAHTQWYVWKESEWGTFFYVRTVRFLTKHHLTCDTCGDERQLTRREFRKLNRVMKRQDSIEGTRVHGLLSRKVERAQLAGKTELQINFIRSSLEAERELERRMQDVTDQDQDR